MLKGIKKLQNTILRNTYGSELTVVVSVFPHSNTTVAEGPLEVNIRGDVQWSVGRTVFLLDSVIGIKTATTGEYPSGAVYILIAECMEV